MKQTLQNKYCRVEYRPNDKQIFGEDLTDHYNDPAFYTKSKRGLKNAWEAIAELWTEEARMRDLMNICQDYKIKTHYWCMVD